MADFLFRLVARALGTAPLARPAVAPLFARGPALAADPSVSPETTAEITVDRFVDAGAEPEARAGRHEGSSTASREQPERPRPRAPRRESMTPSAIETTAPPRFEGQPGEREVAAPAPRTPVTGRASPVSRRDAPRDPRAMPRPQSPAQDVERPRRGVMAPSAGREPRAPIVRISIGRVEVRAVTAPDSRAPAPAPSQTDTRLSLQEYLRAGKRAR